MKTFSSTSLYEYVKALEWQQTRRRDCSGCKMYVHRFEFKFFVCREWIRVVSRAQYKRNYKLLSATKYDEFIKWVSSS